MNQIAETLCCPKGQDIQLLKLINLIKWLYIFEEVESQGYYLKWLVLLKGE